MKVYILCALVFISFSFAMDHEKKEITYLPLPIQKASNAEEGPYTPIMDQPNKLAKIACNTIFRPNNSLHIGTNQTDYEGKVIKAATKIIENNPQCQGSLSRDLSSSGSRSLEIEDRFAEQKRIFYEATENVYKKSELKRKKTVFVCGCLHLFTAGICLALGAGVASAAFLLE